jgi:DNA-directed RNA polymerase specialized sigma24 family protein
MPEVFNHALLTSVLRKSFWIAYLLAGDASLAEKTVLQAIDLWNRCEEDCQRLVQATAEIASRSEVDCACGLHTLLPEELSRVADLPPELRKSFVLRVLLRMSSSDGARLLNLPVAQINHYSCDAVTSLSSLNAF